MPTTVTRLDISTITLISAAAISALLNMLPLRSMAELSFGILESDLGHAVSTVCGLLQSPHTMSKIELVVWSSSPTTRGFGRLSEAKMAESYCSFNTALPRTKVVLRSKGYRDRSQRALKWMDMT